MKSEQESRFKEKAKLSFGYVESEVLGRDIRARKAEVCRGES